MNGTELDRIDNKIIQSLLEDGRASFSQIAREVNLTDVAIKKRVERLKMKGIIHNFSANLNLKVLGYQNPVYIQLRTELTKNKDVVKRIKNIDYVQELHQVLGEYNLLAKVITPGMDHLQGVMGEFEKIDGVIDVKSLTVLETHKKSNTLPAHSLQKKL